MEKKNVLKRCATPVEVAKTYYRVLMAFNNIPIADRELDLLAFSAVYGTFSSPPAKQLFMDTFHVKRSRVGNIIKKLLDKDLLIRDGRKIRINPLLKVDFSQSLILQVNLALDKREDDAEQ